MSLWTEQLEKYAGDRIMAASILVVQLMRGDPATFKQGYTLANAVVAVEGLVATSGTRPSLVEVAELAAAAERWRLVERLRPLLGAVVALQDDFNGYDFVDLDIDFVRELLAAAVECAPAFACGCGATAPNECTAAVEGHFTSLGQRSADELRALVDDDCEAARRLWLFANRREHA